MKALIILLIVTGLTACLPKSQPSSGKKQILVTILPEKSFIEKIAGNDFEVTLLVPPGANPATYSLLPAQMVEISKSTLWFRMGYVGFELSTADRITTIRPELSVVDLSEGLDIISKKSLTRPDVITGHDPHTWLSATNVKIMAGRMLEELVRLNPVKKEAYTVAYQQFMNEIKAVDDSIRNILQDQQGKPFITFHPSLSYFARDYGLVQYAMEEGGKEPSPAHLASLAEIARVKNIRTIYIQSEFDQETANAFAREIEGKVIQIWPLNPSWSENMISMARALSENP